ncbi:MAG: HutD family protein [Tissierellia bacterium]|nr:HutD family protein [Tissierellia bacterium]
MKILKWNDVEVSEWAGGKSYRIYINPESSNVVKRDFDLMLTSATCELDEGVFSDYTGFTRYISPIDNDLLLRVQGEEILLKPNMVYRFSGAIDVVSLTKVVDYNLIIRDDYEASLISISLVNDRNINLEHKNYIIQSFEGDINFKFNGQEGVLNSKDALLLDDKRGEITISSDEAISVFITEF